MLDPQSPFYSEKGSNLFIYLRQCPNQSEDTKILCPKQSASWVMTSRTSRLEAVNTRGGFKKRWIKNVVKIIENIGTKTAIAGNTNFIVVVQMNFGVPPYTNNLNNCKTLA
jgi:hypothetical protein